MRKSEEPHLRTFAQAMVRRDKQLITTRTEGVASLIAHAYKEAGGTPIYMTASDYETLTADPKRVVVFTDIAYQKHLDEKQPGWRDLGWLIIHNPKATEEVSAFLVQLLTDLGTPIEVSA